MTLTDEILENISAYRMESIDAEINAIEAHMEACLRDIRICEECKNVGVIMEGDIIPERGDENIIKYILFFIPRLIINLLRKLREWITGEHIPTAEELRKIQEEERKKADDEIDESFLIESRKMVADKINMDKSKKYPNTSGTMTSSAKGYAYMWGVNIDAAQKLYLKYKNYYEKYLEVFSKLFSKSNITVDDDLTDFEKDLAVMVSSAGGIDEVFSNVVNEKITDETIGGYLEFKKFTEEAGEYIGNFMTKLLKMYHEMDESGRKEVSESNMRFATSYLSSIKVVYAKFTTFNVRLGTEIAAADEALKLIKPVSESIFEDVKNKDKDKAEVLKKRGFV